MLPKAPALAPHVRLLYKRGRRFDCRCITDFVLGRDHNATHLSIVPVRAGRGDDDADTLENITVDDALFMGDTDSLQELTKDIHLTADLTHFFD